MNKFQTFQEFLTTQSVQVPVSGFLLNLFFVAALTFILSRVYVRYGAALSNRRLFARNFMLIAMTTTLIITIVKSSLALSLGLVGALSIVRFRAAIKEPEELSYLFLAIGIGLGFGADQRLITLAAFPVIVAVIVIKNYSHGLTDHQHLYLSVSSSHPQKIRLEQLVETLRKHSLAVNLKRFDETKEELEASFLVEFDDFERLKETKAELRKLDDSVKVTFLDNKGVL
jgi:hypothetical protein